MNEAMITMSPRTGSPDGAVKALKGLTDLMTRLRSGSRIAQRPVLADASDTSPEH